MEATYSRDLINARRVLRVMVFFMFSVCNSILCSVGTSGETEAVTNTKTMTSEQVTNTKTMKRAKVTAAPKPVF